MGMLLRRHNIPLTTNERNAEKHPSSVVLDNTTNESNDFSQYTTPPTDEKAYTKTDINRLSTAELKDLAKKQGIESAEDMTGADLKKVLIEKFGL